MDSLTRHSGAPGPTSSTPDSTLRRVGFLAFGAVGCSVLSGVAAVLSLQLSLPATDSARDMSVPQILIAPFVLLGPWPVLGSAVVGFLLSLLLLWRVSLRKAMPLVIGVCVTVSAVFAPFVGPLACPLALLAGITAMELCRSTRAWRLPEP
jgi:hypothetical protein